MGGQNSTEQKPSSDTTGQNQQQQQQQKMTPEEMQRVREQRAKALQQRMEEKKREEQLKNQDVIDFKNIQPTNDSQSNAQMQINQQEEVKQSQQNQQSGKDNIIWSQEVKLQQNQEQKAGTQQQSNNSAALLEKIKEQQKLAQSTPPPQNTTSTTTATTVQNQPQKQAITKEQRVHNFLCDVFQITNDNSSQNPANKNKTFLYEYCGEGRLFIIEDLDDILMCRLQKNKDENKFKYLYQTYTKLDNHLYVKEKIIDPNTQVPDIKDQIVSYFSTCFQMPETFDLKNQTTQVADNDGSFMGGDMNQMLMQMLQGGGAGGMPGGLTGEKLQSGHVFNFTQMQLHLWEAFEQNGIAAEQEFMQYLIKVLKDSGDEDTISLFFNTLFYKMHLNLNSIKIEKFRVAESQLEMIKLLFQYPESQIAFVRDALFYREGLNGKSVQQETYFGRYLSYSCLATETRGFKDQYFRGMAKSQQSGVTRMTEQVAEQIHNLHKSIQEVMQKLLKNKDCKDRVTQWLRNALALNMEKQKMFTQIPVASDGFMLNLIDILLLFSKPFTSKFSEYHNQFPKINCLYMIDDRFFIGGSKIEKINQELLTQFQQNLLPNPEFTGLTIEPTYKSSLLEDSSTQIAHSNEEFTIPQINFITEVFFLAHLAIHTVEKKLEQQYEQLGKSINKAAGERDIPMYEEFMGQKMSIDAHILGKNTLANFRSLFTFSGALFQAMNSRVKIGDNNNIGHGQQQLSKTSFDNIENFQELCLKSREQQSGNTNTPIDLAALPICILTNLAALPRLFRLVDPESYYGKEVDLHIQVATNVSTIVSQYVKNPHTKAEMIKFLAYLVPQSILNKDKEHPQQAQHREKQDNLYKDIFFQNSTLRELLIEAIVNVYIDSERTGYYEKSSFRFFASMIMEFIWQDNVYRNKFVQLGKERPGLFIEFCNFLINDVNNVLFEGLLELEEIRDFEAMQDSGELNQLDQEMREQMQAKYQENSRKAKAHFQLSNMVVKLLQKVTIDVREPFVSEELGERFANAINYCIDSLVSQKGLKLKVNNPDQYNFEPRALLVNILMMYANMSEEEVFLKHVVNDTRSYKDETFEKALKLINNPKKNIQLDAMRAQKFEVMVHRLKQLRSEIDQEEGLYDDAPEDLLDPIMSTLMKEPVELPSSNNIIDYITIKKHLMNDPHDPFNRSPLTMEMLIPRPDIKQRIEEYKQKKKDEKNVAQ